MAKSSRSLNNQEVRLLVRATSVIAALVDRFGVAFVVLLLIVATVKWLGNGKTQDDFLRELLFGEITGGRSLGVFLAGLVLLALFGVDSIVRARLMESAEMRRLAQEKSRWQERALQTKLSHTDEATQ